MIIERRKKDEGGPCPVFVHADKNHHLSIDLGGNDLIIQGERVILCHEITITEINDEE